MMLREIQEQRMAIELCVAPRKSPENLKMLEEADTWSKVSRALYINNIDLYLVEKNQYLITNDLVEGQ